MKAVKLLSVSVLSFLPSFAFSQDQAKADGPLGFIWGSSVAQAPVEYVSQIDLTRAQDILSELPQYECMQQIMTDGVELATYSKALKVDDFFDAPYQMNINEADVSIGGRVSAYLFDVKFVEKNITACGAYFDNKLFMMYFPERELIAQDVRSLFSAGLEREYGKGEVFGGGDIYITQWVDQSNSVDIQDTLPGGINYLFSPVKLEQLKTWVDFYDGKLSDQIGDSDL